MRDISNELAEVAKHYHFAKTPTIVEELIKQFWRIVRAILEWWNNLTSTHGSSLDSRNVSFLLQIAIFIGAVLALVALVFLLYKKARTTGGDTARSTKGASAVEEILDAQGLRKQAEKLAAAGDYKGACRSVYLSLLQSLHENGIAAFAPAKTNYEYSYTLAKYPNVQTPFRELAERVEVIWFGNREASKEDYESSVVQLDSLAGEIARVAQLKAEQKLNRV